MTHVQFLFSAMQRDSNLREFNNNIKGFVLAVFLKPFHVNVRQFYKNKMHFLNFMNDVFNVAYFMCCNYLIRFNILNDKQIGCCFEILIDRLIQPSILSLSRHYTIMYLI